MRYRVMERRILCENRVANVKKLEIIEECPRGLAFNIRWAPVNAAADDHEAKV